jgi:CAS/CSE protein, C-terminus/Cse1
VNISFE